MFALLSTILILSRVRIVGDESGRIGPSRSSASAVIITTRSVHYHVLGRTSYFAEAAFGGLASQPPRRRLLEHRPRGVKRSYRGNDDYNAVVRGTRYRPRNPLDESRRYYRSAVEDNDENENDDEEEEEEEEEEENNKLNDENEETAEEDEAGNEEETVNEETSEVYDYG